jgi:hypothetical protein
MNQLMKCWTVHVDTLPLLLPLLMLPLLGLSLLGLPLLGLPLLGSLLGSSLSLFLSLQCR